MKLVQDGSSLHADVLSETLNETCEKLLVVSRKITKLNEELADDGARMEKLRAKYQRYPVVIGDLRPERVRDAEDDLHV